MNQNSKQQRFLKFLWFLYTPKKVHRESFSKGIIRIRPKRPDLADPTGIQSATLVDRVHPWTPYTRETSPPALARASRN
jgi:hypothetical protein